VGVGLPTILTAGIVYCRGGCNRTVKPEGNIFSTEKYVNKLEHNEIKQKD
jgi:hypothetical protein